MSPSRLMAIMDPLLNTGFLWRCLAAYAGIKADSKPPRDNLEANTVVTSNDSVAEKERIDNVLSSPGQLVPDSNYIRGNTYYTRLGIFKDKI